MKKLFIYLIKFYRKNISPLKPPTCKFTPTCSVYAITVIDRFGAFKGFFLALWRIIRCSPLTAGGYDPPPKKYNEYY